jgi:hypothetical protein
VSYLPGQVWLGTHINNRETLTSLHNVFGVQFHGLRAAARYSASYTAGAFSFRY